MSDIISISEKEIQRRLKLSVAKRKPLDVMTMEISSKLAERNYTFVNFLDGYVNQRSRVIANCTLHGYWELSVQKAMFGRGCPKCKADKLSQFFSYTPLTAEKIINEKFKGTNWCFKKWKTQCHNQKSKLICHCDTHGEWTTSFDSIHTQGTGCPACGKYGFSRNLPGYMYALRSSCGKFIKIGISNYPTKRIKGLRHKTPFSFELIEKIKFENGFTCKELEKMFHDNFESAGFSGFDGATEWLKWTPDIQHWLRLLN